MYFVIFILRQHNNWLYLYEIHVKYLSVSFFYVEESQRTLQLPLPMPLRVSRVRQSLHVPKILGEIKGKIIMLMATFWGLKFSSIYYGGKADAPVLFRHEWNQAYTNQLYFDNQKSK